MRFQSFVSNWIYLLVIGINFCREAAVLPDEVGAVERLLGVPEAPAKRGKEAN